MNHEAGKGDRRRPRKVSQAEYDANWERAFGKPKTYSDPWGPLEARLPGFTPQQREDAQVFLDTTHHMRLTQSDGQQPALCPTCFNYTVPPGGVVCAWCAGRDKSSPQAE